MAPSTRSKPSTTLDLTLSDSDDSDVVVEQPVLTSKKRATPAKQQQQQPTKKQKGKQAATAREDENASLALAMMLQAEEEDMAAEEEQGIGSSNGHASSSKPRASPRKSAEQAPAPVALPTDVKDPLTLLSTYRKLLAGIGQCKCGSRLSASKAPKLGQSSFADFMTCGTAKCQSCGTSLCRGCWESRLDGARCCSAGRLIVIYEVLAALDVTYLEDHLHEPVAAADRPKVKKARGKPTGAGAGTGYGAQSRSYMANLGAANHLQGTLAGYPGVGVGAGQVLGAAPDAGQEEEEDEQDKIFTSALKILAQLLPKPDHPDAGMCDFLPHEALPALLVASTVPDLLSALLRNDSVQEWTKRGSVYFAMLDMIAALGGSESTLPFLFGDERHDKAWSEGLGPWVEGSGQIVWERKVAPKPVKKGRKRKADSPEPLGELVCAASLYSLFKRLVTQAEAFRRAVTTGEIDNTDIALVGICGDFSAAGDRTKATLAVWLETQGRQEGAEPKKLEVEASGKGKSRAVEEHEWTDKEFEKVADALSYAQIDMGSTKPGGGRTFLSFHYNAEAQQIASSQRPRFTHLAREMAILSTSLPPGIYLRVDESRIDVIKALLTGPEGTPYALGLFEFDIFMPLQYPQVSPVVWLKTTGGNRVRFNPNLYAEGKVCLSLLGTWPGSPEEMWSSKSTLLQVLLSIHSMILGTNFPFYNEPGFGAAKNDKRNKDYNKNTSLATARWAILNWMGDDFSNSIWADVIHTHVKLNYTKIQRQLAVWAADDARIRAWDPQYNSMAGSQHMTPSPYAGATAAYLQLQAVGMQGVMGGQLAAALGDAAGIMGGAPTNGQAAPTNGQATATGARRDLVVEFEERAQVVKGWRSEAWLQDLLL